MSVKNDKIFGVNSTGVNQILPHKNKWAWDLYKQGKNNNWMPEEIPMVKDIQNWKKKNVINVRGSRTQSLVRGQTSEVSLLLRL